MTCDPCASRWPLPAFANARHAALGSESSPGLQWNDRLPQAAHVRRDRLHAAGQAARAPAAVQPRAWPRSRAAHAQRSSAHQYAPYAAGGRSRRLANAARARSSKAVVAAAASPARPRQAAASRPTGHIPLVSIVRSACPHQQPGVSAHTRGPLRHCQHRIVS